MISHHELTMNQDRNSSGRRLQFIVVCAITGAAILYTSLTSGAFQPLDIQVGTFPGGDFIYKTAKRDYAASGSLERHIAEQVGEGLRHNMVDQVYSIFLDDPGKISDGRRWRFASGYLVDNPKSAFSDGAALQRRLLSYNDQIQTTDQTGSKATARRSPVATLEIQTNDPAPRKGWSGQFPQYQWIRVLFALFDANFARFAPVREIPRVLSRCGIVHVQ